MPLREFLTFSHTLTGLTLDYVGGGGVRGNPLKM